MYTKYEPRQVPELIAAAAELVQNGAFDDATKANILSILMGLE
jgi:hypothetical protein